MYNNLPPLPYRENTKFWNKTAIDCFSIKCDCENCFLYKTFFQNTEDECKMKYFVKYNLLKIGLPHL